MSGGVRICMTSSGKTHLIAAEGFHGSRKERYFVRTACGREHDFVRDAVGSPWTGWHVKGEVIASCVACRRTKAYPEALRQHWRYENSAEIAQAQAYVRSRFYPPLPAEYGELAVRAVQACNEGNPEARIEIPDGLNPEPRCAFRAHAKTWAYAARLIEALRLSHMLEVDTEE